MEDVILVKSQQYNAKKGFLITLTVILSLMLLVCVITAIELYAERYEESLAIFKNHSCEGEDHWCKEYSSAQEYAIGCALDFAANCWFRSYGIAGSPVKIVILSLLALSLILGFIGFLWMKSYEMVVTDKRVYGKVAFGKRVDLPNDFISAIAMVPILKGVAVSTSSGKISFLLIKNADEVYEAMNKLLMERQEKKKAAPVVVAAAPAPGGAAELKQYKELLDSGVISQEEFDAKKKQLLGL